MRCEVWVEATGLEICVQNYKIQQSHVTLSTTFDHPDIGLVQVCCFYFFGTDSPCRS